MERVLEKVNIKSITLQAIKTMAITMGFAVVYMLGVEFSPILAKSSYAGVAFLPTIRVVNVIKAFVLITPLASIGTGIGALILDLGSPMSQYIGPFLKVALGVGVWKVSTKMNRTPLKDIALLGAYGALSGLLTSIVNSVLAVAIDNATFTQIFAEFALFKIVTTSLVFMAGYGLVKGYEVIRNACAPSK